MIFPICQHNKDAGAAPATGWIFTCRPDYEAAVRRNLMHFADPKKAIKLDEELVSARGRIQQLESDIEDIRRTTLKAFVRCICGRLKEVGKMCRLCGKG